MFAELHLDAFRMDERHIVTAMLSHLWALLVDSQSDRMNGYGDIDPAAAREIDRYIKPMLRIVEKALDR